MRLTVSCLLAALASCVVGLGEAAAQPVDAELESDEPADDGDDGLDEPDDEAPPDDAPIDPGYDAPLTDAEVAGARPELPEVDEPATPLWQRRLEIGGHAAFVSRPFTTQLGAGAMGYEPNIGWGLHLRFEVLRYLRFQAYLIDSNHDMEIAPGALSTAAPTSISRTATHTEISASTFAFGARLEPTLPLSSRSRAWLTAGIGWGRFQFPTFDVIEPSGGEVLYSVRERAGVFVEFPIGLGISFDIIPRWLLVEYEATAAPVIGNSGNGHESAQAIDEDGNLRDVGPFNSIDASFVQTLGLSLIL